MNQKRLKLGCMAQCRAESLSALVQVNPGAASAKMIFCASRQTAPALVGQQSLLPGQSL